MSKFDLILFDADILIYLAKEQKLEKLFNICMVHLTEIIYNEIQHYEDEFGKHYIDLEQYIENGSLIIIKDIERNSNVENIIIKGRENILFDVHIGEIESITYIYENRDCRFCTADTGAIKCLCALELSENIISLEELFGKNSVSYQFSKEKIKKSIKEGKEMFIQHFFNIK